MHNKYRILADVAFRHLFQATGLLVILLLGGILAMLLINSIWFFMEVPPLRFLSGAEWAPDAGTPAYGVLPLLFSTLLVLLGLVFTLNLTAIYIRQRQRGRY